MKPPGRTIYSTKSYLRKKNYCKCKPENNTQKWRPSSNYIFNKNRKWKYIASEKNYNFRKAYFDAMRTELDYQTYEQPIMRNNAELGSEILMNRVIDASRRHIPNRRATINNLSWINNDAKQAIGRRQRAYETKRRINNLESVAEYFAARRQVQRIVKQETRNKELSIARICKHNSKSFYSYIKVRRINSKGQHRATQNSKRNCYHDRQSNGQHYE